MLSMSLKTVKQQIFYYVQRIFGEKISRLFHINKTDQKRRGTIKNKLLEPSTFLYKVKTVHAFLGGGETFIYENPDVLMLQLEINSSVIVYIAEFINLCLKTFSPSDCRKRLNYL